MAVKAAIHFSDVLHLDQVNDAPASLSLYTTRLPAGTAYDFFCLVLLPRKMRKLNIS